MKTVLMNSRLKEGYLDVTWSPSIDAEKIEVFGFWRELVESGDHIVFEELGQSHVFVVDSFEPSGELMTAEETVGTIGTAQATFVRRDPLEASRLVETIRDQHEGVMKLGGVVRFLFDEHPELRPVIRERLGWRE